MIKRLALLLTIFPVLLARIPIASSSTATPANPNSLAGSVLATASLDNLAKPGLLADRIGNAADHVLPRRTAVEKAYGQLPFAFETNRGQYDRHVRFAYWSARRSYLLTDSALVIALSAGHRTSSPSSNVKASLNSTGRRDPAQDRTVTNPPKTAVVTMQVEGMRTRMRVLGENPLAGKANYLVGQDTAGWHTDIPTYARVSYRGVYRGIDMAFYGSGGGLEYDFAVAPRANPRIIRLKFSGIRQQAIDADGNLVLATAVGQLVHHRPIAYQVNQDVKRNIECSFVISRLGEIGFKLGPYNTHLPLTVDPQIAYSAVIGGGDDSTGMGIAVDSSGNAYVVGFTYYGGFPAVGGTSSTPSGQDAFVLKLDPTGSTIIYSTRIGGTGSDLANGIAVDSAGNAYIIGSTNSKDFPTVKAVQHGLAGPGSRDAFVAKYSHS